MEIEDMPHCIIPQSEDKRQVVSEPAVTFEKVEELLVSFGSLLSCGCNNYGLDFRRHIETCINQKEKRSVRETFCG
jgi:hypothetical protein